MSVVVVVTTTEDDGEAKGTAEEEEVEFVHDSDLARQHTPQQDWRANNSVAASCVFHTRVHLVWCSEHSTPSEPLACACNASLQSPQLRRTITKPKREDSTARTGCANHNGKKRCTKTHTTTARTRMISPSPCAYTRTAPKEEGWTVHSLLTRPSVFLSPLWGSATKIR